MLLRFATAAAVSVLAACLFAQGLNTNARPTDWEEINFEFNSSILSDGYPSLLRLGELLGQHPDYKVRVIGHTDYVGSARYNQKLADSRANTVRDFLIKYGAAAGQLSTVSEGKTNPAYTNSSKEGRFMNRRVTLTVTDGQGRVVGEGGVGDAIDAFKEFMKKQEECCSNILKRLDKLDDILAALRDLKGENDRLKSELADQRTALGALQKQVGGLPTPAQRAADRHHRAGRGQARSRRDAAAQQEVLAARSQRRPHLRQEPHRRLHHFRQGPVLLALRRQRHARRAGAGRVHVLHRPPGRPVRYRSREPRQAVPGRPVLQFQVPQLPGIPERRRARSGVLHRRLPVQPRPRRACSPPRASRIPRC